MVVGEDANKGIGTGGCLFSKSSKHRSGYQGKVAQLLESFRKGSAIIFFRSMPFFEEISTVKAGSECFRCLSRFFMRLNIIEGRTCCLIIPEANRSDPRKNRGKLPKTSLPTGHLKSYPCIVLYRKTRQVD